MKNNKTAARKSSKPAPKSAPASAAAPVKARKTRAAALPTRNAANTRDRILAAARIRFSSQSYETVGTREIAGDAGVDAALVNRYFGGKEKLFAEVITGGFTLDEQLGKNLDVLGVTLVQQILEAPKDAGGFNALSVLLRATGNPPIAALVAERFQAEFVAPLAKMLRGRDAELRATVIASYVIGLATMRHGLDATALSGGAGRKKAATTVGEAIQACVA
jgi:AcrR family transcriptional regulator